MKFFKNFGQDLAIILLVVICMVFLFKSYLTNEVVVEKIVEVEIPVYVYLKDTIVIPKGGSLCGTLKMSETEALAFAEKYNYPVRYNDWGEPNVIIQEGETFIKHWQPDKLKYLVP